MNLETVFLNGVELHYLEQGTGEPVIFIHGALADYRRWEAQFDAFAQHYRMIAYSRRYNFPNNNPDIRPDHSADVEAEDLAAFITALKLGPVHLIGESVGASSGVETGLTASRAGADVSAGRAAGASLGQRYAGRTGRL